MSRTERAQHLYTARAEEDTTALQPEAPYLPNKEQMPNSAYTPNEPEQTGFVPNEETEPFDGFMPNEEQYRTGGFAPNEEQDPYAAYTPNEEADPYAGYTPNEETVYELTDWQQEELPPAPDAAPQVDYAAYYSRESAEQETETEPAFAPPPSMQQYGYQPQEWAEETEFSQETAVNNVYRVRTATWADEDREEAIAESELGYQVKEETQPVRKKSRALRTVLIIVLVLAVLAGAGWLLRDLIAEKLGLESFMPEATEEPFAAVITPEPVKAYDAAPAAAVAETTRNTIAQLSGTVAMENYIVTDSHVVTRNQRADGTWDFYLFTAAEGRLLCYFEGLGPLDMIPQENNTFYVSQAPWLVAPGGSALIRTADIEAALNESVFLHPMYRGWAVVESEVDGHANYVNASGQVLSSLWFSRTFPFTGEYTLAYVDTGSTADADDRYLLYVIGQDGNMSRWLATSHMEDALAAVCGMAYMSDGSLYLLPDTSAPVMVSPEIIAYLDCDAMVVRDPASGKYGLFVRGEQHYDFVYDSIRPLESDIEWAEKTLGGSDAVITLKAVSGAAYPQPLSHSFVLEKDGASEYVALSTSTSYPIRLDGEF